MVLRGSGTDVDLDATTRYGVSGTDIGYARRLQRGGGGRGRGGEEGEREGGGRLVVQMPRMEGAEEGEEEEEDEAGWREEGVRQRAGRVVFREDVEGRRARGRGGGGGPRDAADEEERERREEEAKWRGEKALREGGRRGDKPVWYPVGVASLQKGADGDKEGGKRRGREKEKQAEAEALAASAPSMAG